MSYLEHILRNEKYELMRLVIQGKVEGPGRCPGTKPKTVEPKNNNRTLQNKNRESKMGHDDRQYL